MVVRRNVFRGLTIGMLDWLARSSLWIGACLAATLSMAVLTTSCLPVPVSLYMNGVTMSDAHQTPWRKQDLDELSFNEHRNKFQAMLRNDPDYERVIDTIRGWKHIESASNDTIHGRYLVALSVDAWDRLGDMCWGDYKQGPGRRGPDTLSYRVCVLKEAVRLMQEGEIPTQ